MIQFILMLLGLAFSDNNANTVTTDSNQTPGTVQVQNSPADPDDSAGGDTGGETGQLPPPKK